jgi:hypothetical protein
VVVLDDVVVIVATRSDAIADALRAEDKLAGISSRLEVDAALELDRARARRVAGLLASASGEPEQDEGGR